MAVWSIVPFSRTLAAERLDAEYFQPEYEELATQIESLALPTKPLGELVTSGYRVVYENTEILSEPFDPDHHVRFLQSANIPIWFPSVEADRMGWVSRSDWGRYPKGRIVPGELLIEVKGKAEKVVRVSDDFDSEALATGTLYKMSLDPKQVDPDYVLVYLLSGVGTRLRDRLKSNIMVPYINKDGLYGIPIVIAPVEIQREVAKTYREASAFQNEAKRRYADAEALLSDTLGLDGLTLPTPTCYTAMFSDIVEAERLDAEHFQPRVKAIQQHIKANFGGVPLGTLGKVLKGKTPTEYADEGIPVIRSGDLVDIDDTSDFKRASPKSTAFRLKSGDVLVSSIGFGSIGKVQIFDNPTPHTTVSEVTVIRQSVLNPYFLQAFLASPLGQIQIESWVTGATGQLHLRPADVEKVVVPVIPAGEQAEFERLVSEARALKADAARLLDEAKARVEALVLAA